MAEVIDAPAPPHPPTSPAAPIQVVRCPACRYDLAGLSRGTRRCPECGGDVTESARAGAAAAPAHWSLPKRLVFRFGFLYFGLYFFPFPLSVFTRLMALPAPFRWIGQGAGYLSGWFEQGQNALVLWVGHHLLPLKPGDIPIQPTGSGDTMLGYVQAFTLLLITVLGTAVWSAIDFRRPSYPRLHALWRIYARYALASVLLAYGFAKVPPLQFQPPGPESLVRTYGESSPMGLLWTFMGASMPYTVFAGMAEIVPGLLLLFRRTTTLGALIGAATMTNVVALNFCYDVPVKLYSSHLLLVAVLLVLPDAGRLVNLFVLNRPAPRAHLRTPFAAAWMNWALRAMKAAFLLLLLAGYVYGSYQAWYQRGPGAARGPFAGVYEVESYEVNGEPRPPLLTDASRWRRFMVTRWGGAIVQRMNDTRDRYMFKHDPATGTVELASREGGGKFTLACRVIEKSSPPAASAPPPSTPRDGQAAGPQPPVDIDRLVLEGQLGDERIKVELKKAPDRQFQLTSRGFHWIQEFPYNR